MIRFCAAPERERGKRGETCYERRNDESLWSCSRSRNKGNDIHERVEGEEGEWGRSRTKGSCLVIIIKHKYAVMFTINTIMAAFLVNVFSLCWVLSANTTWRNQLTKQCCKTNPFCFVCNLPLFPPFILLHPWNLSVSKSTHSRAWGSMKTLKKWSRKLVFVLLASARLHSSGNKPFRSKLWSVFRSGNSGTARFWTAPAIKGKSTVIIPVPTEALWFSFICYSRLSGPMRSPAPHLAARLYPHPGSLFSLQGTSLHSLSQRRDQRRFHIVKKLIIWILLSL